MERVIGNMSFVSAWVMSARAARVAVLLSALCGAPPALAQALRGHVLHADSATRAQGVVVLVTDEDGRVVRRALSSASGEFTTPLPGRGRYAVRALRIGFRPTVVGPVEVDADSTFAVRIVLGGESIDLTLVRVTGRTACGDPADPRHDVAHAWIQARTALTAAAISAESPATLARWVTYDRVAGSADSVVTWQRSRIGESSRPRVFSSLPADSLARVGYVVLSDGGLVYYGPDAEVLLSDAFASTHCFLLASTGDPGSIAIDFRPARRDEDRVDVRGRLVLDRATSALRTLAFEYDGFPRGVARGTTGGRVWFSQVPGGAWIVSQWSLRIPTLEFEEPTGRAASPRGIAGLRARVMQVNETGGMLLEVREGDRVVWEGRRRRIAGRLMGPDGTSAPVGARVELEGTGVVARADRTGAFRFDDVVPGRYRLAGGSLVLDSLGLPAPLGVVDARDSSAMTLRLLLPTEDEVFRRWCEQGTNARIAALLRGTVRDSASGEPVARATVRLAWRRQGDEAGAFVPGRQVELQTSEDGTFRYCGVRRGETMRVSVVRDRKIEAGRQVKIPFDRPFVVVDLLIAR